MAGTKRSRYKCRDVMICRFVGKAKGTACRRCGYQLSRDYTNVVIRQCSSTRTLPCEYFSVRIRSIKVSVCNGKDVLRGVYGCRQMGECIPLGPDTNGIISCESCESYKEILDE